MGNFIDENDLKSIFGDSEKMPPPVIQPPPAPQPPVSEPPAEKVYAPEKLTWITAIKFISLFIGIFIVSYVAINSPALAKKSQYFWDVSILKHVYSKAVPTPTPNPFNPASEARLVIPKIGVDVPISWNVPEDQLKTKLLEGVVHSQDTALPGQKGNIFITGHSSYYPWVDSTYKNVFALLDKLSTGDKVFIKYSSAVFNYEVQSSKVVSPNDLSVMSQGDDYNLTLMTCVPIGTNLNRLIVSAHQFQ